MRNLWRLSDADSCRLAAALAAAGRQLPGAEGEQLVAVRAPTPPPPLLLSGLVSVDSNL